MNGLEEEELTFGQVAEGEREQKRDRFGMTDEREGFEGGALYPKLWKLCAGPLVDLPSPGERVVYFPQGHMEQLKVSTNELCDLKIPNIIVASKILCRVLHVKLMVEQETDEVYAEIDLRPESDQSEPKTSDLYVSEPPKPPIYSFYKRFTVSDASSHGGFSVPQKHATDCLPSLDMNQSPPTQELVTHDLHGCEWKFKHIYRGQPRRHLLTTGLNTFATYKKVEAGDAFVFLRCDNGELGVGIRRLTHQPTHMPSSIISKQCMIIGALVAPQFAVNTSTHFIINYNPRINQFIVGFNKYFEAINNKFCIGMRCQMRVEEEDLSKIKRITGTIIEVGVLSPHWTKSEWRSLKVLWDEHVTTPWPERVSPWEIEQVAYVPLNLAQPLVMSKRPKTYDIATSGGVAKVQSSSSEVVWPLRQKESAKGIESSPSLDLSLSLFAVSQEGNKNIFMGYRPPTFSSSLQPRSSTTDFKLFNDVSMETQVKQRSIISMRSRTKVFMEGVDVGHIVDLDAMKRYDDLLDELEKMFMIKGELRPMTKWTVSFTYDDNDNKLLGDNAWQQFCKMVKKIFISSRCENKEK